MQLVSAIGHENTMTELNSECENCFLCSVLVFFPFSAPLLTFIQHHREYRTDTKPFWLNRSPSPRTLHAADLHRSWHLFLRFREPCPLDINELLAFVSAGKSTVHKGLHTVTPASLERASTLPGAPFIII